MDDGAVVDGVSRTVGGAPCAASVLLPLSGSTRAVLDPASTVWTTARCGGSPRRDVGVVAAQLADQTDEVTLC